MMQRNSVKHQGILDQYSRKQGPQPIDNEITAVLRHYFAKIAAF